MMTSRCFVFGACLALGLIASQKSEASVFNLTSGNSTVTIDSACDYGMSDWTVDGVPQLYRQWFWYRVGGIDGEKPISQLNLVSAQQSGPNAVTTVYRKPGQFTIEVSYTLLGGSVGSGYSTIGEQTKIVNLSHNPLDVHFFQYVDFDLGDSGAGDTVQLGQNLSGLFDSAYQNNGASFFADEVISPGANHGQVGLYPTIYNSLTDDSPTTLTDNAGPVTGDTTWAFQWDASIPAGGSFSVALNKSVYVTNIPEPSVIALIPLGLTLLVAARRKSERKQ
jgi:hypothetical protein